MNQILSFIRGKILPLAFGEVFWKLSMLALLMLVSRRFSVGEFGAFNLGLVLHQYAVMLTDFGTRSIGARLIAMDRHSELEIVAGVGHKRLLLFILALGSVSSYIFLSPSVPGELIWFVVAAFFLGMSHEWVLWAKERFWSFACWRSLVGLSTFLIVTIAALTWGELSVLAMGYACAMALGMGLSWILSKVPVYWPSRNVAGSIDALRWSEISFLGLALVANQFFQTGDVMLLAVLSNQDQLGIYGAASRLILFLFGIYYLAVQSLYPWLARRFAENPMDRKMIFSFLGGAGLCGLGLIISFYPFLPGLVRLAFGKEMEIAGTPAVLGVLLFALPFELIMGTWGVMATAAGMNRWALVVTSLGALVNGVLNVFLIPLHGAFGAALASLLSYSIVVALIFLTLSNFFETKYPRQGLSMF